MNEQIRKAVIPAIAGTVGLSVGGVLGYILGQKRTRQEFYDMASNLDNHIMAQQREIDMMTIRLRERFDRAMGDIAGEPGERTDYNRIIDKVQLDSVTLTTDEGAPGHILNVEPVEKTVNIFEPTDWTQAEWEAELNTRSGKTIYTIAKSEFFADDMGYRQSTLTWYEGDRTLADERESVIYNWSSLIGTDLQFGYGSQDDNVVYIRNEETRQEFEICRDPSAHGVEVLGLELEAEYADEDIRHSHAPLKFRRE